MRIQVAAAVAALLCAGCFFSVGGGGGGPAGGPGPPDAGLRVWALPIVHWEPGKPRTVPFAIENGMGRTVRIPEPDPAHARVEVFTGPESVRMCGVVPTDDRSEEPGRIFELEPGDRVSVQVDLTVACASVPPGEYRYEVNYSVPSVPGAPTISGTLATSHGEVVVWAPGALPPPRRAEGVGVGGDR